MPERKTLSPSASTRFLSQIDNEKTNSTPSKHNKATVYSSQVRNLIIMSIFQQSFWTLETIYTILSSEKTKVLDKAGQLCTGCDICPGYTQRPATEDLKLSYTPQDQSRALFTRSRLQPLNAVIGMVFLLYSCKPCDQNVQPSNDKNSASIIPSRWTRSSYEAAGKSFLILPNDCQHAAIENLKKRVSSATRTQLSEQHNARPPSIPQAPRNLQTQSKHFETLILKHVRVQYHHDQNRHSARLLTSRTVNSAKEAHRNVRGQRTRHHFISRTRPKKVSSWPFCSKKGEQQTQQHLQTEEQRTHFDSSKIHRRPQPQDDETSADQQYIAESPEQKPFRFLLPRT